MKKVLLVIVIFFILVNATFADESGLIDYKMWEGIKARDPEGYSRAMYIHGFFDGVELFDSDRYKLLPKNIAVSDYIDQIDLFYMDPANRQIPVGRLLQMATLRYISVPDEAINDLLLDLREEYSGTQP